MSSALCYKNCKWVCSQTRVSVSYVCCCLSAHLSARLSEPLKYLTNCRCWAVGLTDLVESWCSGLHFMHIQFFCLSYPQWGWAVLLCSAYWSVNPQVRASESLLEISVSSVPLANSDTKLVVNWLYCVNRKVRWQRIRLVACPLPMPRLRKRSYPALTYPGLSFEIETQSNLGGLCLRYLCFPMFFSCWDLIALLTVCNLCYCLVGWWYSFRLLLEQHCTCFSSILCCELHIDFDSPTFPCLILWPRVCPSFLSVNRTVFFLLENCNE